MCMSLKIFHGKIHASKLPFCLPNNAPRGPTTVNGRAGSTWREIRRGWSDWIGKVGIAERGASGVCADTVPRKRNMAIGRIRLAVFMVKDNLCEEMLAGYSSLNLQLS